MASTPMDVDIESSPADVPQLNITRTLGTGVNVTTPVSEVIANFRPTRVWHATSTALRVVQNAKLTGCDQLFKRDESKDGKIPYILSIDYDDPGELCMTSESDETIQIYNVREGRHDKTLLSKKYGVKLAKFTHASSSIIYASTKQNGRLGAMLDMITN